MADRDPLRLDQILTPMQQLTLIVVVLGILALAAFGAAMLILAVLT
jgi:hypothetical protein